MPSRVLFSCFRLFPFFSFTTTVIAPQKSYYIIVITMMVVLLRQRYRSYYKSINNKYNILLWYTAWLPVGLISAVYNTSILEQNDIHTFVI